MSVVSINLLAYNRPNSLFALILRSINNRVAVCYRIYGREQIKRRVETTTIVFTKRKHSNNILTMN